MILKVVNKVNDRNMLPAFSLIFQLIYTGFGEFLGYNFADQIRRVSPKYTYAINKRLFTYFNISP